MLPPRLFVILAGLLTAAGLARMEDVRADELSVVAEWLARPILDPAQPLHEVQEFCERRVPPMPQVSSVEEWERYAKQARQRTLNDVVFRGEAKAWRDHPAKVEFLETLEVAPEYRIRKLRYEALPGLWIPALLYEPVRLDGPVPVVLNVNGHDRDGKAAKYKQIRCINQAKRGMLALNTEWFGMGQLATSDFLHYRMNQLDLCGTSGVAPFYLAMSRGLDVLLSHQNADPKRVAVTGLSGGGWQTIFISGLDERVTLCDPVAGYSSFRTRARFLSDLGDSEQTPVDLGVTADYAQLTAMRAPHPTLLTFNAKDQCCFASGHALPPLLEAAKPIFELYGKGDHLRSHINHDPGTHNFERDNREALYRMFGDFFFAGDRTFSAVEIPCDAEVKSAEDLKVELPSVNEDFHSLAMKLSQNLPHGPAAPTEPAALADWRRERRATLSGIIRQRHYRTQPEAVSDQSADGIRLRQWKLQMDRTWTIPATSFERGTSSGVTIVLHDDGRKAASDRVVELLQSGRIVVALDPFYFGESKIASRDFLYGLLVSAIGDRPLGVQAAQINAAAQWASREFSTSDVHVDASGHRTSLMTLIAAASDAETIRAATVQQPLNSLRDVIEKNISVNEQPELFCFGLLAEFDLPSLIDLAGGHRIHVRGTAKP